MTIVTAAAVAAAIDPGAAAAVHAGEPVTQLIPGVQLPGRGRQEAQHVAPEVKQASWTRTGTWYTRAHTSGKQAGEEARGRQHTPAHTRGRAEAAQATQDTRGMHEDKGSVVGARGTHVSFALHLAIDDGGGLRECDATIELRGGGACVDVAAVGQQDHACATATRCTGGAWHVLTHRMLVSTQPEPAISSR